MKGSSKGFLKFALTYQPWQFFGRILRLSGASDLTVRNIANTNQNRKIRGRTNKHTTSCKPLLICATKGSAGTLEFAAIANSLRWPSANCPLKVWVIDDAELIVSCEITTSHIKCSSMVNKGPVIYTAHGSEKAYWTWWLVRNEVKLSAKNVLLAEDFLLIYIIIFLIRKVSW